MFTHKNKLNSIGVLSLFCATVTPVWAANTTWTGATGDWTVSGNWNTGVPTAADFFAINNAGTAQLAAAGVAKSGGLGVFAGNSGTLQVSSGGNLTLTDDLSIGDAGTGNLTISGTGTVTNLDGLIGKSGGGVGTVTISGGLWTNTGELRVGNSGTGNLNINGGTITNNIQASLGTTANGVGTVVVAGGTWQSSNQILVGFFGKGRLTINSGSVTSTSFMSISANTASTSDGAVVVNGGLLSVTSLLVGGSNAGRLDITGGQVTTTTTSSIGYLAGGNGTVVMTGGRWDANALIVGDNTTAVGSLTIGGTAVLKANQFVICDSNTATGTVNLNSGGVLESQYITSVGGTRSLVFDGGTLRLLGNNSFLFNGFSVGNIQLAAGGGTFDTQAFDVQTLVGLTGTGGFTKTGTGTFTFRSGGSPSNYTGATLVNQGSLIVDGQLGNTAVTVANGGLLGGSGTILGGVTVQSGGILAPGNSPGILSVGSLTLNSGSTTRMEINGLTAGTQHDQIQVTGNAALDGTLDLDFGFVPVDGDSFTLIEAGSFAFNGDAVEGFDDITTNLGAALRADVVTDPTTFNIQIALIQQAYLPFALTHNQRSVAKNLDTFSTSGADQPLIDALNLLSADELPTAFDLIAPEEFAAFGEVVFANTRNVFATLNGRRMALEYGEQDPGSGKNAIVADDEKFGFFVSGFGDQGGTDSDGNGGSFDFTTAGTFLGADYRLNAQSVIGLYASYQNTDVDSGSGSKFTMDSVKFGAYGNWRGEQGTWFSATVGGGIHGYDSERQSFGGIAFSDTEGTDVNTEVGLGHDFKIDKWTLGSQANLAYTRVMIDGFRERGSLSPLVVDDITADSLRLSVVAMVSYEQRLQEIVLRPYARLGWQHEFLDTEQSVNARLASGAGGAFSVLGSGTGRDTLVGGIGVQAKISEAVGISAGYDVEASSDIENHSVNVSFGYRF